MAGLKYSMLAFKRLVDINLNSENIRDVQMLLVYHQNQPYSYHEYVIQHSICTSTRGAYIEFDKLNSIFIYYNVNTLPFLKQESSCA